MIEWFSITNNPLSFTASPLWLERYNPLNSTKRVPREVSVQSEYRVDTTGSSSEKYG